VRIHQHWIRISHLITLADHKCAWILNRVLSGRSIFKDLFALSDSSLYTKFYTQGPSFFTTQALLDVYTRTKVLESAIHDIHLDEEKKEMNYTGARRLAKDVAHLVGKQMNGPPLFINIKNPLDDQFTTASPFSVHSALSLQSTASSSSSPVNPLSTAAHPFSSSSSSSALNPFSTVANPFSSSSSSSALNPFSTVAAPLSSSSTANSSSSTASLSSSVNPSGSSGNSNITDMEQSDLTASNPNCISNNNIIIAPPTMHNCGYMCKAILDTVLEHLIPKNSPHKKKFIQEIAGAVGSSEKGKIVASIGTYRRLIIR
jgi:hypothetical protein